MARSQKRIHRENKGGVGKTVLGEEKALPKSETDNYDMLRTLRNPDSSNYNADFYFKADAIH